MPAWLGPIAGPIVGGAVAYYANLDSAAGQPQRLTLITIVGVVVGFVLGCFVWISERRRKRAQVRDEPPPAATPSRDADRRRPPPRY